MIDELGPNAGPKIELLAEPERPAREHTGRDPKALPRAVEDPDGEMVDLPMNSPVEVPATVPQIGELAFAFAYGMDMFKAVRYAALTVVDSTWLFLRHQP